MEVTKTAAAAPRSSDRLALRRFRGPLLNAAAGLIICLGLLQCWLIFQSMRGRATQIDFSIYYLSAKALEAHENPYIANFLSEGAKIGGDTGTIPHATDPPTFILMMAPLARMSFDHAFWAWSAFNFSCLATALFLLFGEISELELRAGLALAAISVLYPPVADHFYYAQSKLLVLMLLVLSVYLMQRRHDSWSGLALALACLTRMFPLLLLGYLALQRRWKMLAYTVIWLAIGAFVTVALFGLRNVLSFQEAIAFLRERGNLRIADIALRGFTTRLFWHVFGPHLSPTIESVRGLLRFVIGGGILWFTIVATLMRPAERDLDWSLFTLWTTTALILTPVVWLHDEVLLIPLFAQIASAASQGRTSARVIVMSAVSVILMMAWVLVGANHGIGDPSRWHPLAELGWFSLLAAYFSAYWFATDEPDASPIALRAMPAEIWRRLIPTT